MEHRSTNMARNHRQTSATRRAARPAQRGSIFVEALIVCVLLTLFFAGCLGLHQLYAAKLQAMHDARALTWGKAFGREGCAPALDAANLFRNVVDAADDPIGIGLPVDVETPRSLAPQGTFGHVEEASGYEFIGPDLFGWSQVSVQHSMQLACSEPTQSNHGTLMDAALYGVRTLLPDLFRQ
jgi:hypothetical protein